MLILIFFFILIPIACANTALEKMIELYFSGEVSQDDPRFRTFTIDKLWASTMQAQVLSPRYGTIRFSGLRENMNAKLIYTISGRPWLPSVSTTCTNSSTCDVKLNHDLMADTGQTLTWEVRTDSWWPLGAHLLANGTLYWELEEGTSNGDVITESSLFDGVDCSQSTFVIGSESDVRGPDGTVQYTQTNSQILLEGARPACIALNFTVPGTSNTNRTAVWIQITQTKLIYKTPLQKSDRFIYTWVPVGVTKDDKNEKWSFESSVYLSDTFVKPEINCFRWKNFGNRCYKLTDFNEWYGGQTGSDTCKECEDIRSKLSICDVLYKNKIPVNNICEEPYHGGFRGGTSPSLTPNTYREQVACPDKGIGLDVMCNGGLQIATRNPNSLFETMKQVNRGSKLGEVIKYDKWSPNFNPMSGSLDDARFIAFNNAPDAQVRCTVEGRGIYQGKEHEVTGTKGCNPDAMSCVWEGNQATTITADNLNVNFQYEWKVDCTSKRIRPVKFYRSLDISKKKRVLFRQLKVQVVVVGENSFRGKMLPIELDATNGNNGVTIDLGEGQNIVLNSESIDTPNSGVNDMSYGLYEVTGQQSSRYEIPTPDGSIKNLGSYDPFVTATHHCVSNDDNTISCDIPGEKIFANSDGVDAFTQFVNKMPTFEDGRYEFFKNQNGSPIQMTENIPGLPNKNVYLSGLFKLDVLVNEIIPTECSATITSGECNGKFYMSVKVKAVKNEGFVKLDYSKLIGVLSLQTDTVLAGKEVNEMTVTGISKPDSNNCTIEGTIKLVGTDGASCSIDIGKKQLAVIDRVIPTIPPSPTPAPSTIDTDSPTTPNPNASTGADGSETNLPLIIGLVVGGLLLVGGGLVFYFFVLEDNGDQESSSKVDYII